jgi:hypothetical protein
MLEAVHTSETSVYFNETTRHFFPDGYHLLNISTVQNGGVDHVRLLPVCEIYLHAYFLLYFSGITKREYKSRSADSFHVIQHRLLVAGFSLRRRLMLNTFRADDIFAHQISSDLLIGSVSSPYSSSSVSLSFILQDFRTQNHTYYTCMALLTLRYKSFLEQLIVSHVVNKFTFLLQHDHTSPCSQKLGFGYSSLRIRDLRFSRPLQLANFSSL